MITMQDTVLAVYPNRQQMLALIQARAALAAGDCADEPCSAAPERPDPVCVPLPY
jgi:hypothetical protein